jgi:hypothetical protein
MAEQRINTMYYTDSGKVIQKDTWQDDSGQQWDTFTTVHNSAGNGMPDGTVVDWQGQLASDEAARQQNPQLQDTSRVQTQSRTDTSPNFMNDLGSTFGRGTNYARADNSQQNVSTALPSQQPQQRSQVNEGGGSVSVNPANPLGPNPRPVMPVGTGANPTQPNPAAGPMPTTGQTAGNQTLYNWDNPTQALVNTMRAQGQAINPMNPLFQMLMRAAPGLANAFLIQGAGNNAQSNDYTGDFSRFLGNAVSSGNIPSLLSQARNDLGSIIPQARAYAAADQGGAANPLASNTLLGSLTSSLMSNNGSGILDVLNNLNTPTMNRSSASAYQNLLGGPAGLGSQATYELGRGLMGGDLSKDFWYYLLGR